MSNKSVRTTPACRISCCQMHLAGMACNSPKLSKYACYVSYTHISSLCGPECQAQPLGDWLAGFTTASKQVPLTYAGLQERPQPISRNCHINLFGLLAVTSQGQASELGP
eukprot:6194153-Pleurochrysis_carterae.AAC.10